ncbi:hypothetical protein C5167_035880 [Papaver somniferum]|uniref:Uncharacterized protein n=1 Tax=Papaver somniferum TaxID=3469 RepID=A0A4Y7J5A6_PAPSO|nr:hypothetical protein C5167_014858 [Papaver somniferum]RZC93364.1 hypothetical protein C5167_035880 [Papaver somniferum]
MATYHKNSSFNIVSIGIMALLFVALMSDFTNASSMMVWSGPGCNNSGQVIRKCGCSPINLRGGYNFIYNGQTAALYNEDGCRGVVHTRLGDNARMCSGFGWKSVLIQC